MGRTKGQLHQKFKPLADRFWMRVNKGNPDECWLWLGAKTSRGTRKGRYGVISRGGRDRTPLLAHRASWELEAGGPPPADMLVLHRCDNPPCVNPAHLYLGTFADNMHDRVERSSLTRWTRAQIEQLRADVADVLTSLPPDTAAVIRGRRLHEVGKRYGMPLGYLREVLKGRKRSRF